MPYKQQYQKIISLINAHHTIVSLATGYHFNVVLIAVEQCPATFFIYHCCILSCLPIVCRYKINTLLQLEILTYFSHCSSNII